MKKVLSKVKEVLSPMQVLIQLVSRIMLIQLVNRIMLRAVLIQLVSRIMLIQLVSRIMLILEAQWAHRRLPPH